MVVWVGGGVLDLQVATIAADRVRVAILGYRGASGSTPSSTTPAVYADRYGTYVGNACTVEVHCCSYTCIQVKGCTRTLL